MSKRRDNPPPPPEPPDISLEKGLPSSIDTERLVLGAILAGSADNFLTVGSILEPDDFALEKHRRIFRAMLELAEKGDAIDRITMANALRNAGQLESVDGFSYIISLDDGLPEIYNLDGYAEIVKEKSRLRKIIFKSQETIDQCLLEQTKSSDLLSSLSSELMAFDSGKDSSGGAMSAGEIVENYEGGFGAFIDPTRRKQGFRTGFTRFDEQTGGLVPGRQYFLGARPGMGKSAFVGGLMTKLAKDGVPNLLASLEMTKEEYLTRMICSEAQVDHQKFLNNYLGQDERLKLMRALTDITEMPLYIDDSGSMDFLKLQQRVTYYRAKHGVRVVFIDHLGLMKRHHGAPKSGYEDVLALARITAAGKALAKLLDIVVFFIVQLSRNVEQRSNKRPMLSDFRGAGNIEEDGDVAFFLFRDEKYRPNRKDLAGKAELIFGKNRHGPEATVKMRFIKEYTRFTNWDDPQDSDAPPPGKDEGDEI